MIPFIRSLSELMAITKSRDRIKEVSQRNKPTKQPIKSSKRERPIRSTGEELISLPSLPKSTKLKLIKSKEALSKFFDELDYNNQIQSSYDLTLIESQSKTDHRDVA